MGRRTVLALLVARRGSRTAESTFSPAGRPDSVADRVMSRKTAASLLAGHQSLATTRQALTAR